MKKMIVLAVGFIMALGSSTSVFCADATFNLDVNSAYISRGWTYNDGIVLQPSIDILKGGFDINIWGNMDIGDYDGALDSGEFSELDLAMYYSRSFDKLTLTGGIIEYVYPQTDESGGAKSTVELYLAGSFTVLEGLSLGLNAYYDYDEYKDTIYSTLGLTYSVPVNDKLGLTAGLLAGYVERDEEFGESGFNEYKVSLKASYALTEMIGVAAHLNYTDAIDDDVLPFVDVNTFGGVSVNCKY